MDPDFQYRTTPNIVSATRPVYSTDDAEEGTLRSVYRDLKKVMDEVDAWHAFDLKGKNGDTGLTVKQQIVAHAKAYEMVQPALDAIESALAKIDDKYKDRS